MEQSTMAANARFAMKSAMVGTTIAITGRMKHSPAFTTACKVALHMAPVREVNAATQTATGVSAKIQEYGFACRVIVKSVIAEMEIAAHSREPVMIHVSVVHGDAAR